MDEPRPYKQSARKFARERRRAMTRAETKLWWEVRDHKLGFSFRRQMPFGPSYTADFACPAAKLIVEVDGRTHDDEETAGRDAARQKWVEREGWKVLRFSDAEVIGGLDLVIAEIRKSCLARSPVVVGKS